MAEDLISVAKLRKPHKVSGAFRFLLLRELRNKKKFPKHFLMEVKGQALPFFVKEVEVISMEEGIVQFEEITSPEQARAYNGKELMLDAKTVAQFFKPDSADFLFLAGFDLLNAKNDKVGVVDDVVETVMQVFLQIKTETGEALIPLTEDWVLDINKKAKTIQMDFPEELLHL